MYVIASVCRGDFTISARAADVLDRMAKKPETSAAPSGLGWPMPVDAGRNVSNTLRDSKKRVRAALNSAYQSLMRSL